MFLWQSLGITLMMLSGVYLFRLSYAGRIPNEKGLKALVIKAGVYGGFGFLCNFKAMDINSTEKVLDKTDNYGK